MAQTVPVTPVAGMIVVGPRGGPTNLYDVLIERAARWRRTRIPVGSVDSTPWATGSVDVAVRDAVRSVDDALDGGAAVVDPERRVTTFLRLLGEGRTRWSGIRSLTDLALGPDRVREPADGLTILSPWAGLLIPEPLTAPDSMPMCVAAVRTTDSLQPHCGLGWADRADQALRHAVLDGLRSMSANAVPAAGRIVVGASGATESTWLLDGSLALLTGYSRDTRRHALPDTDFDVVIRHVPQISGALRLASVVRRSSNSVVAAAWGRQSDEAIDHAVSAARVRELVPRVPPGPTGPGRPETAALINTLSPDDVQRLLYDIHTVVFGRSGRRVLGVRVTCDPLVGRQTLAWGPVWLG